MTVQQEDLGSFERHMRTAASKRATTKQQPPQIIARVSETRTKSPGTKEHSMAAKKSVTVPAKPSKGKAAKPSSNGEANPRARKNGLRTAQVRILEALVKAKGPATKGRLCSICAPTFPTAAKHQAWMGDPLGGVDPVARQAAEEKAGYLSLLTLKYVKMDVIGGDDVPKERVYEITAAGRKALEAVSK